MSFSPRPSILPRSGSGNAIADPLQGAQGNTSTSYPTILFQPGRAETVSENLSKNLTGNDTPVGDVADVISTLTREDLNELARQHRFPKDVWITLPRDSDRAHLPPVGFVTLYYDYAVVGLRFPVSSFLKNLLGEYRLPLSQIHPNGVSVILGFTIGCLRVNIIPTPGLFHRFYSLKRGSKGMRGWFTFTIKKKLQFKVGLRDKVHDWSEKYFFCRTDIEWCNLSWHTWNNSPYQPRAYYCPTLDEQVPLLNRLCHIDCNFKESEVQRARLLSNFEENVTPPPAKVRGKKGKKKVSAFTGISLNLEDEDVEMTDTPQVVEDVNVATEQVAQHDPPTTEQVAEDVAGVNPPGSGALAVIPHPQTSSQDAGAKDKIANKSKRKANDKSSKHEKRSKNKHAAPPGTIASMGPIESMPPMTVSKAIDVRFGLANILRDVTTYAEGLENRWFDSKQKLTAKVAEVEGQLAASEEAREKEHTAAAERESLLEQQVGQLKEEAAAEKLLLERQIEDLNKEVAARQEDLAASGRELTSRTKDLKDARESLDAANRNHGKLLKAFFCKLLLTADFTSFATSLASAASTQIQKMTLDWVMKQRPELDLKDKKLGYSENPEEITKKVYARKVLAPPRMALLEALMEKSAKGALSPDDVYSCTVPEDSFLAGKAVQYGAGSSQSSRSSTSAPPTTRTEEVGK